MPETALADLTIAGTDLPERWWSIRKITPDPFAPNWSTHNRPTITFCRLCLWNDFITDHAVKNEVMDAVLKLLRGPIAECRE
jgi:hypothetical protein